MMLYFEDIAVGRTDRFGRYEVTREEVLDFAGKYDPQPFHLNDEAAAKTHFGRIAASGWHTGAMAMAMMVAHWKETGLVGLGSPGIDELRWLKPVYPGDILRAETETLGKRQSKSRPEIGFVKTRLTVYNQKNEPVMTLLNDGMVQVRDPGGTDR